MLNTLKMPTYNELIGLSDGELTKRIGLALSQVDKAEERHEYMIDKAKIYLAYRNELAKRNYKQRAVAALRNPSHPKALEQAYNAIAQRYWRQHGNQFRL